MASLEVYQIQSLSTNTRDLELSCFSLNICSVVSSRQVMNMGLSGFLLFLLKSSELEFPYGTPIMYVCCYS